MTAVAEVPTPTVRTPSSSLSLRYPFVLSLLMVLVAVLPYELAVLAAITVLLVAVALHSPLDSAQVLVTLVIAVGVVPANLTIPALGSMGNPHSLIGLGALMVWGVTWLAPKPVRDDRIRPIPLMIAGFVAVNLASFVAAGLRPVDALERSAADRGIIMMAAAGGIAMLGAESIRSRRRLTAVVQAMVIAGAIIALAGIVQFITGIDVAAKIQLPGFAPLRDGSFIGERSTFRRVAGTTAHPIEFSAVLCMVAPLAIHLFLRRGRIWLAPLVVIGVALPMSVSRTAVVGMAAVAISLVPSWPVKLRRRVYLGGVLYLVVMRFAFPGLLGTIRALFVDAGADPSVETRRTDYEFVSRFVSERPFFGRGTGTFLPERFDFLDNQYLMSLVENGFVGLAMYLTLVVGAILVASSIRRRSTDEEDRDLAQALLASLAVVGSTSAAFDFLSFASARTMFFLVVGLVGALWRLTSGPPAVELLSPLPLRGVEPIPNEGRFSHDHL